MLETTTDILENDVLRRWHEVLRALLKTESMRLLGEAKMMVEREIEKGIE